MVHDYYDKATETLFIADLSDIDNQNPNGLPVLEDGPFNGDIFHGYMTCQMSEEDLLNMLDIGADPVEYALETMPAPGTCASNRMGFIGWRDALAMDCSSFMILR